MPVPAMTQAINAPATPVACPNFDGRVKIPAPIIEPMTSEIREPSDSFLSDVDIRDSTRPYQS